MAVEDEIVSVSSENVQNDVFENQVIMVIPTQCIEVYSYLEKEKKHETI